MMVIRFTQVLVFVIGIIGLSQVGIGTTNPVYDLDVVGKLNLNKGIAAGTALHINDAEALWYNGTFFSWGFGATANYFADPIGINVTDPQATLDVNGDLRVRNLPLNNDNTQVLTVDNDGNVTRSNNYIINNITSAVATDPVTQRIGRNEIINNIDLGLENTITIPAGKEAMIVVNYSVPVGTELAQTISSRSYYGVRFLENGVEAQAGSRKSTVVAEAGNANMTSITCSYVKILAPAAMDRVFTYTLRGYLESASAPNPVTYRFNMWSATGANYNWGKATLITQLFIR